MTLAQNISNRKSLRSQGVQEVGKGDRCEEREVGKGDRCEEREVGLGECDLDRVGKAYGQRC